MPPHFSLQRAITCAAGMLWETVSPICTHSFWSHEVLSCVMFTMGSSSHSRTGNTRSAASTWNDVSMGYCPIMKSISGNTSYHDFALPSIASLLPDISNHTRGLNGSPVAIASRTVGICEWHHV